MSLATPLGRKVRTPVGNSSKKWKKFPYLSCARDIWDNEQLSLVGGAICFNQGVLIVRRWFVGIVCGSKKNHLWESTIGKARRAALAPRYGHRHKAPEVQSEIWHKRDMICDCSCQQVPKAYIW
jgi:hypothetical protein